jgi:hypothetical protein
MTAKLSVARPALDPASPSHVAEAEASPPRSRDPEAERDWGPQMEATEEA